MLVAGFVAAMALLGVVAAGVLAATAAVPVSDFQVYWGAVQEVLAGRDPYAVDTYAPGWQMPFIYPPFALLVLAPIGLMALEPARIGWSLVEVVIALGLVVVVRDQTRFREQGWGLPALIGLALAGAAVLASLPVLYGVTTGQIGLGLVALVVVDFTLLPPKWRGTLTGVAAAIKLTPLILLPYLLVTRQWRIAAVAAGSFVAATALGWLVLPADSTRFWTQIVFDGTRIGGPSGVGNKSLLGLLTHWVDDSSSLRLLWWVLAGLIAAASLWQARRQYRRGDEFAAVLTVGLLSTVISPISWVHHLAWLSLAAVYLIFLGRRGPAVLGVGLLLALLPGSILVSLEGSGSSLVNMVGDAVGLPGLLLAVFGLPRPVPMSPEVS